MQQHVDTLFSFLLILHIAGGMIGLLAGSLNLLLKKGGKRHVRIGKIFMYGMLTASSSALVLSALHPNAFLFMVGMFTLYMVSTGQRYIYLKLLEKDQRPAFLDWTLTISMTLSGLFLVGLGVWNLVNSVPFGWVYVTFGLFGLLFVKQDLENYGGKSKFKNYWLMAHIGRMTGGYIASLTAFLVVNMKYSPIAFPPVVVWLFPSLLLVPFIIRWGRKYGVKKLEQ